MKAKKKKKRAIRLSKINGVWQLAGRKNRHHDINKVNHGTDDPKNIYHWDINVHRAWHLIFGNRSIIESAEWLMHIHRMKQQDVEVKINNEEFLYGSPT